MAKATLPVNYVDDALNSAMDGKRRYKVINNADGTISLEDVTTYDQVGSNFGASQLNAICKAINESADSGKIIDDIDAIRATTQEGYIAGALALKAVDSSLGTLSFGQDDNGNWGYRIAGADPVIPFKSGTNFGLISLAYKEGTKTFTINTKGKDILYYSTGVISPSTIKIIKNGTTTSLSNDSVPLKSSNFAAIIVDGVTLAHSIDVSDVDEITVSCYSNTSANSRCDFIYSFENIAKLESNYILYAKS